MPSRRDDLLGRVARATGLTAASAALVASSCAALAANRVIASAEEQRLVDQANVILAELATMSNEQASLEAHAEARELEALGLRIAVFDGATTLGGDVAFARAPSGCSVAGELLRCRVSRGSRSCVVATRELLAGRLAVFAVATLAALVVAAVLGTFVGRRAARWAVQPLTNLAERVSRADPDDPKLGSRDGVREVDDLREALETAWGRMRVALSSARRFSADAAHELRTPLTTLRGELELLEERITDLDLLAEVRRVRASAVRLSRLTERLLVLARVSTDLPVRDAVDLREIVDAVVSRLDADDAARVSIKGEDCTIRGDETLLDALFDNALQNALKHGRGDVHVELAEREGRVSLDVRDQGPGVPSADRARMFEPFVRGSNVAGVEGHGIGLALIAHVAALHGGTATFRDAPAGAWLTVTLPAFR